MDCAQPTEHYSQMMSMMIRFLFKNLTEIIYCSSGAWRSHISSRIVVFIIRSLLYGLCRHLLKVLITYMRFVEKFFIFIKKVVARGVIAQIIEWVQWIDVLWIIKCNFAVVIPDIFIQYPESIVSNFSLIFQ